MKPYFFLYALCVLSVFSHAQDDTLKVMYYNILNYPSDDPARIVSMENISQYLLPDVLVVNELISDAGATDILDNALNQNGLTYYQRAAFIDGPDTDNGLFYNSNKLTLYSQDTIRTALRLINEYTLYVNDPNLASHQDTTFISFYSLHLKASSGGTNQQLRLAEMQELVDHLNQNSTWSNVIVGGDFNVYASSEPAYQLITNSAGNDLQDPINMPGNWHTNASFAAIHTQSTRDQQIGSGSSGGMDDRFDQILVSDDIMAGTNRVEFVNGTYEAFGNDGLHYNNAITDPPAHPFLPATLIQDLHDMSDHLPVLMDLSIEYAAPLACDTPPGITTENITPSSARLSWSPAPGADHYQIRGRPLGLPSFITLAIPYTNPTYFDVSGLASNVTYEWQIKTYCSPDETEESGWTALTQFTTLPCPAVDSNYTTNLGFTTARLNWTPTSSATGYRIQGRPLGYSGLVKLSVGGGATNFFDVSGLTIGTSYEWQVAAFCNTSGTSISTFTPMDTFTTIGFNKVAHDENHPDAGVVEEIRIFPNPVRDMLTIRTPPASEPLKVIVFNSTGQAVAKFEMGASEVRQLDVREWSVGLYQAVIQSREQSLSSKIVVVR